jgi:Helix-turn-helix domain
LGSKEGGLSRRLLRVVARCKSATQLGLCTATIYGLCADGALPHMRILNAIRIAPVDLTAFIAARRR